MAPGEPFFHTYSVTLDVPTKAGYTYQGSALGVTLVSINGVCALTLVAKGSEAERRGMTVGSVVAQLGGEEVSATADGYERVLKRLHDERPITVGLKRLHAVPLLRGGVASEHTAVYWSGSAVVYERNECAVPRTRYCVLSGGCGEAKLEWWTDASQKHAVGAVNLAARCAAARRAAAVAIAMLECDSDGALTFDDACGRTMCLIPPTGAARIEWAAAFGLLARGGAPKPNALTPPVATTALAPWDSPRSRWAPATLAEGYLWLRDADRAASASSAPRCMSAWRRRWVVLRADGRACELAAGPESFAAPRAALRVVLVGAALLGHGDPEVPAASDLPTVAATLVAGSGGRSEKRARAAWKEAALERTFVLRTPACVCTAVVESEEDGAMWRCAVRELVASPPSPAVARARALALASFRDFPARFAREGAVFSFCLMAAANATADAADAATSDAAADAATVARTARNRSSVVTRAAFEAVAGTWFTLLCDRRTARATFDALAPSAQLRLEPWAKFVGALVVGTQFDSAWHALRRSYKIAPSQLVVALERGVGGAEDEAALVTRRRTVGGGTLALTQRWLLFEQGERTLVAELVALRSCKRCDYVNGLGLAVRGGALRLAVAPGALYALVKATDAESSRTTFTKVSAKHDAFFVLFSQMKALFGGDSGGAPARARLVERIVNEMRGAAVEGAAYRAALEGAPLLERGSLASRVRRGKVELWAAANCVRHRALTKAGCGVAAASALLLFSAATPLTHVDVLHGGDDLCPPRVVAHLAHLDECARRDVDDSRAFELARFKAELHCFSSLFIAPVKDLARRVGDVVNWRSPLISLVCLLVGLALAWHDLARALPPLFLGVQALLGAVSGTRYARVARESAERAARGARGGDGSGGGAAAEKPKMESAASLVARVRGLKTTHRQFGIVQRGFVILNHGLLKLRAIYMWRDPMRSLLFCAVLVFAALVAAFAPSRAVLLAVVLFTFTRPLRPQKSTIGAAVRLFWSGLEVEDSFESVLRSA